MKPLAQAIQVARRLLADGQTGSALAEGLRPVTSILSVSEKTRLAAAISREYYILGHAAHDPNQYKTCQAAKEAKDKSEDAHLKILTYKTPMCGSCGLNRQGHCRLMGGKLVDGPNHVPEPSVHRTADLLVANHQVDEGEARLIAQGDGNATARMAALHQKKADLRAGGDHSGDQKAESRARIAAAILAPAGSTPIPRRKFRGPARRRNAEVMGLGVADDPDDHPASVGSFRAAAMFSGAMEVEMPMDRPRRRASRIEVAAAPEMGRAGTVREASSQDVFDQDELGLAQSQLARLATRASRLLGQGEMTTRAASKLYHHMDDLVNLGAVPSPATAAIQRQLNALGGGMEI